jgi:hypothetical protein
MHTLNKMAVMFLSLALHLEGADASRRRAIELSLESGDFASLDAYRSIESIDVLYSLLKTSMTNQFGEKSKLVEQELRKRIAAIPGHAEYLGRRIDRSAALVGSQREREDAFWILGRMATPEAIREIARFLDDTRNPEQVLNLPESAHIYGCPNNHYAAQALAIAVGEESPIDGRKLDFGPADIQKVQSWWQSSGQLKFSISPPGAQSAVGGGAVSAATQAVRSRDMRQHESEALSRVVWSLGFALFATVVGLAWWRTRYRRERQ